MYKYLRKEEYEGCSEIIVNKIKLDNADNDVAVF